MNIKPIFITTVLAVAVSIPAYGASAKFAAGWDTDVVAVGAYSDCVDSTCSGKETNTKAEVELAKLHVGAQKSILVGVSSEIGIWMLTEAKGGKNSTGDFSSSAMTEGSVDVTLTLMTDDGTTCDIAPDNSVTLKSEMRKLTVSGGGTFEDTTDEFWINVAIETDSKGAHHFEFLGTECEQGEYTLTAIFDLTAIAEAGGVDSAADVVVTLGDRMITMQEVRAVRGSLVSDDDPAQP
ncbi:MAG TPA: hypothetical protein ENI05_02770, partial [Porticoccus sp.]|nr:hypothetical protein [Porticoccus sp.]